MAIKPLEAGVDVPNDINVVIEISGQSSPVKYEMNKETNVLMVNRFLTTSMHYPCDYGFIPSTLAEDKDPMDVIVLTPYPLLPGSVILSRPIGLLRMTDESGPDTKILAVPVDRISTRYQHAQSPNDIEEGLLSRIAHFFSHYKDLETGKWSKVGGWEDATLAKEEILASVERYKKQHAYGV